MPAWKLNQYVDHNIAARELCSCKDKSPSSKNSWFHWVNFQTPSTSSCPLHRSLFTWAWVSSFTSLSISFLLDILQIIFLTAQVDWQHSVSKHKKVLNMIEMSLLYCLQTLRSLISDFNGILILKNLLSSFS